tara:strand:- start:321 stop:2063 length:1743 start_codon:yes stop_codon:yes gene_type:complete
MPLKKCQSENKDGWKWGESGNCYIGPDAKKQAIRQGIAIEGPEKFSQKAFEEGWDISDQDVKSVSDWMYEQGGYSLAKVVAVTSALNSLKDDHYEEITADNFVIPDPEDYLQIEAEDQEEWYWAAERPGLWENIRKKKEREGKNYRPAKPGDPDRPTPQQLKRAQSKEVQKDVFDNPGEAMKRAKELGLEGIHSHESKKTGETIFMPGKTHEAYEKKLREEMSNALQRGKPGPNDPRKTPAPKKDQKKGSKKNKPDSAKDDKGKITFSKKTIDKLKSKMAEHNKKGKGSKASLGALKAVYRRGAGAYSTSHAPKMSRDGWAMARVNAFLYLLRNGRPSNPNYKQDNDLLPSSHPRSTKAAMTEKQKEALDKDKDGKITKKDFEMLRKSEGYGLPKHIVERELKKRHAEVEPIVKEKKKGKKYTSFIKKQQVTAPPTMTWQGAEENSTPNHFGSGKNINILGYQTKHFDICASAVMLFSELLEEPNINKAKSNVISAARAIDEFFGIEKEVVENNTATDEQGDKALELTQEFAYQIGNISSTIERDYSSEISFVSMHFDEIGKRMSSKASYKYRDPNWPNI